MEYKVNVGFGDVEERIVSDTFVAGENRLVLIGRKLTRALDVVSGKFLETHPLESPPELYEDRPRVISPDGRRMLIFGNYLSSEKKDKVKRPPAIWDLQTGKQIARLDKTKRPIFLARWSKNGKTLVTSDDRFDSTEISLLGRRDLRV